MNDNNRYFYSGNSKCKNGCVYCFSSWNLPYSEYTKKCSIKNEIIYPTCDSEFFDLGIECVKRIIGLFDSQSTLSTMSISTKSDIDLECLELIQDYNRSNCKNNIIKVSVSITNKSMNDSIEPNALPYEDRLYLIKKISLHRVPTCVILKPLLPFIEKEEYFSIITDCLKYTHDFVVGGLYVDTKSKFFFKYISQKYKVERRFCTWQNKELSYVEHPYYYEIVRFINESSGNCFFSDKEYIDKVLKMREENEKDENNFSNNS